MKSTSIMHKRIITFGTFDVFHEGHYNILKRAKTYGGHLIVGISSDALNAAKGKKSQWNLNKRIEHLMRCEFVDEYFIEESLAEKKKYIELYKADVLVMGDDWEGAFDWVGIPCVYLPRTKNISSTAAKILHATSLDNYTFLFCDSGEEESKYGEYYTMLANYLNTYNINHFELGRDAALLTDEIIAQIDAVIFFNAVEVDFDLILDGKIRQKPRILIDHGAAYTKWFLSNPNRYAAMDYFLVAGKAHKRAMESFFGTDDAVISAGFLKSELLYAPPKLTREQLCALYGLDFDKPIVVYAPTWFETANQAVVAAHNKVIEQLCNYGNYLVSLHPKNKNDCHLECNKLVADYDSSEIMKLCDIIVSDNSSMLSEALVVHKKTIQILMPSYVDNPSKYYQYPRMAGTGDFFVAGIPARPEQLTEKLATLDKIPASVYEVFRYNVRMGTYMCEDAHEKIVAELIRVVDKPFVRKSKVITSPKMPLEVDRYFIADLCGRDNLQVAISTAVKDGFKLVQLDSAAVSAAVCASLDSCNDVLAILIFSSATMQYSVAVESILQQVEIGRNLILQVRSLEEYQLLESKGISECFLTLGQNAMEDCFSKEVFDCLKYIAQGRVELVGISLTNVNAITLENNIENPLFYALQSFGKPIYIDKPYFERNTMRALLQKSCGFYCAQYPADHDAFWTEQGADALNATIGKKEYVMA